MLHRGNAQVPSPRPLAVDCQTDTFKANISFDDVLTSALRSRPNRIILSEVRGIEARTLLGSFNTIAADFLTRFTKKERLIPQPIEENEYATA
jgi:type IV secretory pathway ATPase VirB11/archaellum biosynthesis ATPase